MRSIKREKRNRGKTDAMSKGNVKIQD